MDDAEVTRQAIGISLASMSQLETTVKKATSDFEILSAYTELCPFVASSSPAIKAALEALQKAPKVRRVTTRQKSPREPIPEATRVSMRITISAWSQLLVQSETLNDFEVMRQYILQCPYVASTSKATALAIEGLQQACTFNPPPLDSAESDSEESAVDKERGRAAHDKKSDTGSTVSAAKKQNQANVRPILFLLRSILLDFPMALLLASYLAMLWVQRVDKLYIVPSMQAAEWTEERAEQEITYYNRHCTSRDITAKSADELLVPTNATIQEAYEHQLKHGFSIFQGVLTDDVMHDLRTYVDSRNRKLSAEESIFVIENENRFSFGLGTEVPSVAEAVKQLSTHSKMAPTLEKVLGPNPALIEMTAITASYGAVSQYWHDDVIASASVMKYGRTFGPSYSIFIQLQNTTKAMGATDTCPGTHKCSTGEMEKFCESRGFQAVDSRTGYWKAGDALLMNMNSYHRGYGHSDPNAEDRAMLILTFVPKPGERAESRQLSQGITFSLRWDMWGHTLWDLAQADKRMTQPWATLRALGLFKPRDAAWGVDYVSSATMRMANEDNGFRRDELDTFLERGGFHWLPKFLHGQVKDDQNWHEFYVDTLERCIEFLGYINIFVVTLYGISLVVLFGLLPEHFGSRGVGRSVLRSAVVCGLVFILWQAANNHVDNTDWAKDIRAGRRYSVDFGAEQAIIPTLKLLPSTMPHQKDVLIETRYGSRQFHMYNDFTNDHPGNRYFLKLVRKYGFAYSQVKSGMFRKAAAAFVVSAIRHRQSRFLIQNGNEWRWLGESDAIDFAMAELAVEATPFLKPIRQSIRFLESDYKYGVLRNTALARRSLEDLKAVKKRLLLDTPSGKAIFTVANKHSGVAILPKANKFTQLRHKLMILSRLRPLSDLTRRRRIVGIAKEPKEPRSGAWLKSGDRVEGTEFLEDGEAHWYTGVLDKVTASGDYFTAYDDKSFGVLSGNFIRAYEPYYVGEELEVFMAEGVVSFATIVADNGNGTFDVFLDEEEQLVRQVPRGDIRRYREDAAEEKRVVRNHYA